MPTDECRLPLTPVLPWQRPPVTRNRKGQWQRGISGNPKGRPTKAKLAARLAARPADPPPLKWSDLRYVFDIQEDCNGKEAIQA